MTGKFQGGTSTPAGSGLSAWLAVGAVVMLVGEVASAPSWPLLGLGALVALLVAGWSWRGGSPSRFGVSVALTVMGMLLATASFRLWQLAATPDRSVRTASSAVVQERDRLLATTVAGARQAARYALDRAANVPAGQVQDLDDLLVSSDLELGVVVLGGDTVIAVGGAQRTQPIAEGVAAAVVTTPFVRSLVVTEHRSQREAQVAILLDASPAVPVAGPSLATRSGSIGWHWDSMPPISTFTSLADARVAVQRVMRPAPPAVSDLRHREAARARWLALTGVLIIAVIALASGAPALVRLGAMVLPLWVLDRTGLVPPVVGGFALKALLIGVALLLLAVALWRTPARRNRLGLIAAAILLAMAPLLVIAAASRLSPPAEPGTMLTWFAWQAVLALGTAAYMLLAAAPLRGADDAAASGRTAWLATGVAVLVGTLGILAWRPAAHPGGVGWPLWYLPLWLLPVGLLLAVTSPSARRIAITTTAVVLAVLAAWGASLEQRIAAANADLDALALPVDSLVEQPLRQLADSIRARDVHLLPDLYATWHASAVHDLDIPTQLAIWSDSAVRGWVALDSLAVSWDDLKRLVVEDRGTADIVSLARGAGRHHVLIVPVDPTTTVTVVVGPRSRLVRPTRFGRLVGWRSPAEPAYQLTSPAAAPDVVASAFVRRERFVRADRLVRAGDAPRVVRATITMSTPQPFLIRAALIVLLDILLVLLAWGGVHRMMGAMHGPATAVFRRSYQRTVVTALISFFVVPAAFFAVWSALRLRQEVSRSRAADASRALISLADDPALAAPRTGQPTPIDLALIADRAGAEFGLYRHGRLVAGSLALIADLGVLAPVLDPALLSGGGTEPPPLARPMPDADVRLSAERLDDEVAIAAALPGVDVQLARGQVDLALLLLLASLGGTLAALLVARAVARALGQPIELLRQRAIAIGRRQPAPPLRLPPTEFQPVFEAINQMERDLGESEARLEEETARTARVVAWGEMARQVAHEIKNPLTPMRLGLQHLRRLGADGRPDLPAQVDATVERLLVEIDRLDRIARAFARFGAPQPSEREPLAAVELHEVVGEITQLFTLGGTGPQVRGPGEGRMTVSARREELVQVLLNLVDNARQAGAHHIDVEVGPSELRVRDDGHGMSAEQLGRIFEPAFSTTTSGTGLGLAIVRRMVEGWGASISVASTEGVGTSFTIRFAGASTAGGSPA
ncbi:MAG TPA: ATP-binding protein [Gemmatimonadales bacterium]|nr:ATP-binding protein [Gemmatimonadales bacterium]